MTKILLTKLQCIVNDEIDEDEVFLKYKGEKYGLILGSIEASILPKHLTSM